MGASPPKSHRNHDRKIKLERHLAARPGPNQQRLAGGIVGTGEERYLGILDIRADRQVEWLGMTTEPTKADLLQGTLDMLLLKAVADEPLHGYALVHRLRLISGERLQIPQGSLYPALHRLEYKGFLKSAWAATETGREAKMYSLTAKGRRHLEASITRWRELSTAIALVLGTT